MTATVLKLLSALDGVCRSVNTSKPSITESSTAVTVTV